MFSNDRKEKSQSKITIEAIDCLIMEDLLSYLYIGVVLIERESCAIKLLFAADYFMVSGFEEDCWRFHHEKSGSFKLPWGDTPYIRMIGMTVVFFRGCSSKIL